VTAAAARGWAPLVAVVSVACLSCVVCVAGPWRVLAGGRGVGCVPVLCCLRGWVVANAPLGGRAFHDVAGLARRD